MYSARIDIPNRSPRQWVCAICNIAVNPVAIGNEKGEKVYMPASKYWDGEGTDVYCSAGHSVIGHKKEPPEHTSSTGVESVTIPE
jgi:hypothetical protein